MDSRITILTPCLNSGSTLEQTILSIKSQVQRPHEHIVIDGGSTDQTTLILKNYGQDIKVVSKPGEGLYRSLNFGLALSSGDIVGILNSDDFYANNTVLLEVSKAFERKDVDLVYGDLVYVDKKHAEKPIRYLKPGKFQKGSYGRGWIVPHPTLFVRRRVYDEFGGFDPTYTIASDVDLTIRLFEREQLASHYIASPLVHMRVGGISNRSIKNIIVQNFEIIRSLKINRCEFNVLAFIIGKCVFRFQERSAAMRLRKVSL